MPSTCKGNKMVTRKRGLAQAGGVALATCLFFTASLMEAAPKRVLVCSVTQGFKHDVIPSLNTALRELDGADARFEVVAWVTNKQGDAAAKDRLALLAPDALRTNQIDLVIFNNTSGNLSLPDVDGFVRWVEEGGAFVGIHAAADTLKSDPRYTEMIQGVFAGHGAQVSGLLHADDTDHPANAGIGKEWFIQQEEIYLFKGYDRNKFRSLWHMRHHPNHPNQEGFFPIAWCRMQGQGRVFYTALGHRIDLVSLDPALEGRVNPVETAQQFRDHLRAGIMWALGFEDGSAEPNPDHN